MVYLGEQKISFDSPTLIKDEPKDVVRFIDYDGIILTSYSKSEAEELTALPEMPSHSGLSAQSWNYTLEDLKDTLSASGQCDIGCIYTTDDGKTRITISLVEQKYTNYSLVFAQTVANGVQLDWGDGSPIQTFSETSQLTATHQYSPSSYPAVYIVTFNVVAGTMSFPYYITGKPNTIAMYSSTNSIEEIHIGNNVTDIGNYAFMNCLHLKCITMSNSLSSIGNQVYYQNYQLKTIIFPRYITSIGTNICSDCINITTVVLPNSITIIPIRAFSKTYSLRSIVIPASVKTLLAWVFENCYSLENIAIPNGILKIDQSVFQGCAIKSMSLPTSLSSIGYSLFDSCDSLISVEVPDAFGNQFGIYSGCTSIKTATIPSSTTYIRSYAFQNCYSLESIEIPDSVTTIGTYAFYSCKSLRKIKISNSLKSIESYAFQNCYSLGSIKIPKTITSIKANAFNSSSNIITFDFREHTSVPSLANVNAFASTNTSKEIIVPDELYDSWKSASNWSSTTNNIMNCIVKASESSLGPLN